MLNKFVRLISPRNRILRAAEKNAKKVDQLAEKFRKMSDDELRNLSDDLIAQVQNGKSLDDIAVTAFALIREVIFRETNEYAYLVQLIGAFIVHSGDFAEMVTGEGKTLTLLIAAYLNALKKEGVHIVTVNEYLAKRDADYAEKILKRLGLTVGCNTSNISGFLKKQAFNCDITYTTNSELGFDYLRDNMVQDYNNKKIRSLNFAIVDEGDSILIDEARTPLIISGQPQKNFEMYIKVDGFVSKLNPDDYRIDPESRSPSLTTSGINKAEVFFNTNNLFNIENSDIVHKISNALVANFVFKSGKEYIVRDGKILIVDQFTGRILHGRSYNSGLHQAIQAKERVEIEPENLIIATITYQSFFRLYKKLAAVSGTAVTESEEFLKIYNMVVVPVPTNKPVIRKDYPDFIFGIAGAKWNAVVAEIKKHHSFGQPILVGTGSVEDSEHLSNLLRDINIPHEVLNAKNNSREAEIIKLAGQKNSVTISTNMAGRGTDIKLGEGVAELGGLYVIGTERHEARRIDKQLRGRSGRQGDPGISRFFISFSDPLFKRFAHDRIEKAIKKLNEDYFNSRFFSRMLQNTQKKIESINFDIRKNLIDYDHVLTNQRELIYKQRDQILISNKFDKIVKQMLIKATRSIIDSTNIKINYDQQEIHNLLEKISSSYSISLDLNEASLLKMGYNELDALLNNYLEAQLEKKINSYPKELLSSTLRDILIRSIDKFWTIHLDQMVKLREGVQLRSYEQTLPLNVYVKEADLMFTNTLTKIAIHVIKSIFEMVIPRFVGDSQVSDSLVTALSGELSVSAEEAEKILRSVIKSEESDKRR